MKKIIFGLALIMPTLNSHAEWVRYGTNPFSLNGEGDYYDTESVKRSGDSILLWTKTGGVRKNGTEHWIYTKVVFDCFKQEETTLHMKVTEGDQVLIDKRVSDRSEIKTVSYDDKGYSAYHLYEKLCSRKAKGKGS